MSGVTSIRDLEIVDQSSALHQYLHHQPQRTIHGVPLHGKHYKLCGNEGSILKEEEPKQQEGREEVQGSV